MGPNFAIRPRLLVRMRLTASFVSGTLSEFGYAINHVNTVSPGHVQNTVSSLDAANLGLSTSKGVSNLHEKVIIYGHFEGAIIFESLHTNKYSTENFRVKMRFYFHRS